LISDNATDLACILVEPLQRYLTPIAGFLEGLRELATRYHCLLIFDEVVTGFRLAYGGAQEYYRVIPDIVAYGKALGGGYPLGAVAGPVKIMELCTRRHKPPARVYQGGTLSGNPISAVAALAVLEELRKPGVYTSLRELGEYGRAGLQKLFAQHSIAARVLGDGPIVHVLFTDQDVVDYRSALSADKRKSYAFHTSLLRNGVLVNPYGRMYLSTAHTLEDLDFLFAASKRAVEEMTILSRNCE
jgi:glutamate-1-semialdehyde 2,1-aminomutase